MRLIVTFAVFALLLCSCQPLASSLPTLVPVPTRTWHAPTLAPPTIPAATPVPQPIPNKRGVHLLLDDGRNVWPVALWTQHLQHARRAVGPWGYVTELIRGDDLDVLRWQQFFNLCSEYELSPILRLATTYDTENQWWRKPAPDADNSYHSVASHYAAFVRDLVWPTAEHYVIIGNEPNHGNEWGGRPDPAAYARFMVDVATAIHAVDPQARILNAGLDPYAPHTGSYPFIDGMYYMDAETFMDEMKAAVPDAFSHLDVWCSHAYPLGPFTEPPWRQIYGRDLINDAVNPLHREPPSGIYNRGINGYEWELFKLATYGVTSLPIMITETGWRHAETVDPLAVDGGPGLPDAATVARYFDLSMYGNRGGYPDLPATGWTPWQEDPHVIAVTPFALNGLPREWGHTNWLALSAAGQILSVYAPYDFWVSGSKPPSHR
ncbi:MAG: hypothetical protein JW892_11435 [Anaerolineae bacterium]|nr:hypothetical protein [Anaerolineae bacterium]